MPARTAPPPAHTPWLTKREAAAYLRISVDTLNRWEDAGKVTFHKVADLQSVRLNRDELDALMRAVERDS